MSKLENDPQEFCGEMHTEKKPSKENAWGVWFIFCAIFGFSLGEMIFNGFSLGKFVLLLICVVILGLIGNSIGKRSLEEKSL